MVDGERARVILRLPFLTSTIGQAWSESKNLDELFVGDERELAEFLQFTHDRKETVDARKRPAL